MQLILKNWNYALIKINNYFYLLFNYLFIPYLTKK